MAWNNGISRAMRPSEPQLLRPTHRPVPSSRQQVRTFQDSTSPCASRLTRLCPSGKRRKIPGDLTHAIGHRVVREPTEMLHPDEHTGMPAFDGAILEIVQIFHGRMVDNLSR